jgi:hypothetical protein
MTAREIRAEIRNTRREMKQAGIKRISCFNGGLSQAEYRCNARLYQLGVDLSDAVKLEAAQHKEAGK